MAASAKIQLLVDADVHGIEVIRQGISCLEKEGYEVHTLLFAPPRRESNRNWKRFISEPGVIFCAVPRATTYSTEPNDEAIVSAMMRFSHRMHGAGRLALLTSDAGFVGPVAEAKAFVLIPEGRIGVVNKYEAAGAQVIKLQETNAAPKVRAILHDDGTGSVQMAEAYNKSTHPPPHEIVQAFFEDLGLKADQGCLIQKCAKYWFENCSGSITVYPPHLATSAVHDVMHKVKSNSGKVYFDNLAFFLPISAPGGRLTKQSQETFESGLACQVWRGGGPFVKKDSPTLVAEVFQKLGYVDEVDADLKEPMFCFLNRAANKYLLRQVGMLPVSGDSRSDILRKLRGAFLSNLSTGQWQVNKRDDVGELHKTTLILRKAELLARNGAPFSREEIFAAMQIYAQKEGLQLMQTYDALALRIRIHNQADPAARQLIEIEWLEWTNSIEWKFQWFLSTKNLSLSQWGKINFQSLAVKAAENTCLALPLLPAVQKAWNLWMVGAGSDTLTHPFLFGISSLAPSGGNGTICLPIYGIWPVALWFWTLWIVQRWR